MIIKGTPKAQKRHRHTKRGIVYDPSSQDKKEYLKQLNINNKPSFKGAISIIVKFIMPYPKKYYRSGKYKHLLKNNAPTNVEVKPDLDNLLKLLLDVLQDAKWIKNDSKICEIFAKKEYGENPRTEFEIFETEEHEQIL